MQAAKAQAKSQAKSYKVLLVEDEGVIARDIAQRIEALGHRVTEIVSTGEEAIKAAPGADIVLMDIRLDGPMDGIEAAEAIHRRFQIPVIFLTAHADRSMVDRAKQARPCGYIVKPVAPAALHTSIEIAVYKHAMERAVAESEAWLRAVLASVADAVAVADAGGRVRILNPAAESLTGWSESEAKGQDLAKIVPLIYTPPESRDSRAADAQAADAREGIVALAMLRDAAVALDREAHLKTRSGRHIPVEGTAAPVRAALGNVAMGAALSLRDVSRRRWEEQQIRQAQKVEAAAKLAAGVAQEYTNLLAVIRVQSERLLDQFGDYSPVREAAEEIRQAASAAEQITRKLAGFGKRRPINPEVLSPNGILRRIAKLLETVAGFDVKVTIRPGLHAGRVKADEGQLEQLFMNLTMHAGRRSASGGQIQIETGSAEGPVASSRDCEANGDLGDYVRIAISYQPAANRSQRDAKRAVPGAGFASASDLFDSVSIEDGEDDSLALSAAHNIVSEHNGFLSATHLERPPSPVNAVEGVGEDGGVSGLVCLEVLLPRWSEPAVAAVSAPPLLTHTVLLVEPREIVRAELHKFFEANGLDLLEAADVSEAIALAEVRDGPLDLVIAPAFEAGLIFDALTETRPTVACSCKILRIFDLPEPDSGLERTRSNYNGAARNSGELRRPYTQVALLERVRSLLSDPSQEEGGTFSLP